jgi:hypothetical protein
MTGLLADITSGLAKITLGRDLAQLAQLERGFGYFSRFWLA